MSDEDTGLVVNGITVIAPASRRKGITISVIIEVSEGMDADLEAAAIGGMVKGYLDKLLEERIRIDGWIPSAAHVWDNPDHGGDMIRYDHNPRGV